VKTNFLIFAEISRLFLASIALPRFFSSSAMAQLTAVRGLGLSLNIKILNFESATSKSKAANKANINIFGLTC
jgi:hypothetical protein